MPECQVRIYGQEGKYRGARMYLQEEMPAKLQCMERAEYEELRQLVDQGLEPLNRALACVRTSRILRFVRWVPPVACPLAFAAALLPCVLMSILPPWPKGQGLWMLVSLTAALTLVFGALLALRLRHENTIDRQTADAFRDIDRSCREFSRGKRFRVDVRRRRVRTGPAHGALPADRSSAGGELCGEPRAGGLAGADGGAAGGGHQRGRASVDRRG
mmetsp:Transcript_17555/g.48454  ORF Transcript_17555/g.48454 Transcript_17555/m.48454 type:complete len:216 (-) Transcript_17555:81-728(-)